VNYNIVGNILFSQSLSAIRQQLESLKKDNFDPLDRIIINQDILDEYPYIDGVGTKLIEIQKIINQVDISNCFILLVTPNSDVAREIDFVTRYYSVDTTPMRFQVIDGDYQKTIKKYSNTACKKLWNHFYVGTDGNVNPCCTADHRFPLGNIDELDADSIISNTANQIRLNMAQGYRARACATCYEKEDSGIQSIRQVCDPPDMKIGVSDIDIRLNNICNFKCRMCSEYFSSAIQQETMELYGKNPVLGFEKMSLDPTTRQVKNQRLQKILSFVTADLRSIYFAGGEPLITGEHYEILDRLIAVQNTNLAIRYNTNLSTLCYKQSNVIDLWQQFSDVTVGASIDAGGVVAEYMRHGTVWNDIVNNIHTIKKDVPHVKLRITSTVSSLTIENLIALQNFWLDQQLFQIDDFRVQVLITPNFLSPAALPIHHKDRLSDIIRQHMQKLKGTGLAKQWNDVLQWMNNHDYTFALKDFAHRTNILDAHRKESFALVFPEYKDLL
jgi:radical SAM protein with 4Fe4S-binding SPASM domain